MPIYDPVHGWQPGKATHCAKCRIPRPERAHHCRICDICVMRMDHHCPWINNCVGFNNHKFFILLGIYGAVAGIVGVLTTLPEMVYVAAGLMLHDGHAWQVRFLTEQGPMLVLDQVQFLLSTSDSIAFLLAGVLGALAAVFLSLLSAQHLPLAQENCTTIEENYGKVGNPFNLGSCVANLEQIFGALGPDWLIPVRPCNSMSDGVAFPPFDDCFGSNILSSVEAMTPEQIWTRRYNVQPRRPPAVEPLAGGPFSWLAKFR